MRLWQDNCGNIIKETETAEDYLLLEIERLKEENAKLQQELKAEKDKAQIILNKLNNKIIDTQYQLGNCKNENAKNDIRCRIQAFYYVKGMVEYVIYDREKEQENEKCKNI